MGSICLTQVNIKVKLKFNVARKRHIEKALEAREIRKMAVKKSKWIQLFVVFKKRKPPDRSSKLVR